MATLCLGFLGFRGFRIRGLGSGFRCGRFRVNLGAGAAFRFKT